MKRGSCHEITKVFSIFKITNKKFFSIFTNHDSRNCIFANHDTQITGHKNTPLPMNDNHYMKLSIIDLKN